MRKVQEKCEICVRSKKEKNLKESVGNKVWRKCPIEMTGSLKMLIRKCDLEKVKNINETREGWKPRSHESTCVKMCVVFG